MRKKILGACAAMTIICVSLTNNRLRLNDPHVPYQLLREVEAFSNPEYDAVIIKCKSSCETLSGHCIQAVLNGEYGVKCDYTSDENKDCCGIEIHQNSVS